MLALLPGLVLTRAKRLPLDKTVRPRGQVSLQRGAATFMNFTVPVANPPSISVTTAAADIGISEELMKENLIFHRRRDWRPDEEAPCPRRDAAKWFRYAALDLTWSPGCRALTGCIPICAPSTWTDPAVPGEQRRLPRPWACLTLLGAACRGRPAPNSRPTRSMASMSSRLSASNLTATVVK